MSLHKVRNMDILSQPVLSEGLVYGKCGFTDIDLSCDWQGRYFVFLELKHGTSSLPRGQKYHLQALVRAIRAGGREAVAILAHHQASRGEPIMAADATVTGVYGGRAWEWPDNGPRLQDFIGELYTTYMESRK